MRLAVTALALTAGLPVIAELRDVADRQTERQVTYAPHGHVLTNTAVWSPDGRWIVHDVRSADNVFDGTRIEQVDGETGETRVLHESSNGAGCAVASYHPREPKVVFLEGPENPAPDWSYAASRRRGLWLKADEPGRSHALDAMNYAPPFRPGALRGGSHLHVFSPDGAWVSFTYEDEVLARLDRQPGAPAHEANQRNVGVAVPAGPVHVAAAHPRNHDGDFFSVLVTRTTDRPRPGSDDISRAFEEGWVGNHGYIRADGTPQTRALAFLGMVTAADGRQHAEVFIVDLPDDLTQEGTAPLGGTATTRPAPPAGVTQRRLTFTEARRHRGATLAPRHWVRSSPDGVQLAFVMRDDAGVAQLWSVPPQGGEPRQISRHPSGIASAFSWSPDGRWIAHLMDGSVFVTEAATGHGWRLTPRRTGDDAPEPYACVFSPDGRRIAYTRRINHQAQIFTVTTSLP
ncbi:MAG: DUF3748 domain-containing protein [Opitutaceae bacterium]|nr:DUF3748 domain-containing protein [Opitutaceae bacterium]